MRKDREQAITLRKEGKTYLEISRTLNVPKGTLSYWFYGLVWSEETKQKNIVMAGKKAQEHMVAMNRARAERLVLRYEQSEKDACAEFPDYSSQPLFIAALMLYLGEGDKSLLNNHVQVTNTDVAVLRIFHSFLLKYCAVSPQKIRIWILGYPDLDMPACEKRWSKELNIPLDQFYKSQVIEGRHKTKKLLYGVGTIIIGDKRLKRKILRWITLLCDKIEFDAGMV